MPEDEGSRDDKANESTELSQISELVAFKEKFSFNCDEIVDVINLSDEMMMRARVIFKNDYQLSIVSGLYSYGGSDEFEIAVFDPAGEFATEDVLDASDVVVGYLSAETVTRVIETVGAYTMLIEVKEGDELINPSSI